MNLCAICERPLEPGSALLTLLKSCPGCVETRIRNLVALEQGLLELSIALKPLSVACSKLAFAIEMVKAEKEKT